MKKKNLIMAYPSVVKKVILVISCIFCIQGEGKTETYTFIGGGAAFSTHWTNVDNWQSGNYPGLTVDADDVVNVLADCLIPALITVEIYGKIQIEFFGSGGLSDFHIDGRLEIHGELEGFVTASNITIQPDAELIIAFGGIINSQRSMIIENGGSLVNGGTINHSQGSFYIHGYFANSGLSIIESTTYNYLTGLIHNTGELIFRNRYNSDLDIWSSFTFNNFGTINNRPSASFYNSLGFTNHLTSGQITNFDGATFFIDPAGDSQAFINSGTITNNAASGASPAGKFIIHHDFENNLTFNNNGKVTLDSGAVFNQSLVLTNPSGAELIIEDGSFNALVPFANAGSITVNNLGNLNLDVQFDNLGDITINSGGHLGNNNTFNNSKNLTINQGGTLVNDDFLNHQVGGNFQIYGSFTNNDIFWNADNVFISTDGNFINNDTFNNFSTSTFGTSGLFTSNSSGFILNTGIFNNYSAGTASISGTFNGHGDILNNGAIQLPGTWTSDGEFTNNGTLNINASGTLNNNDFLNNIGNLDINGTFTNNDTQDNKGILDIETGGLYTNNSNFNNWSAGAFTIKGVFHNMGTHLNNGSQSTTNSGTYSGSGLVTGGIDNMYGLLSPGSSPGLLTASGYLSFESTGSLKTEIAGTGAAGTPTGFDQVNVNGSNLSGTLEVVLLDGFIPTVGDQYIILISANPITGSFDNITLPTGHDFIITYNTNDVTVQYAGVLPVELISFTGRKKNNYVQLNWRTASELNNAGFEIQRMEHNNLWETIGSVNGYGTTLHFQDYQFIDKTVRKGDNYYRLKQVDFDGQFEYSKVVNVYLNNAFKITFYPNPLEEVLHIEGLESYQGKTNIEIFDELGRLHYSKQLEINKNLNSIDIGEVVSFEVGTYFLVISNADQAYTFSLVKVRE